jgi:hypothetical protein
MAPLHTPIEAPYRAATNHQPTTQRGTNTMSTTISLDTATSSGPPAATFTAPGATLVVGIVNVNEYQQRDFATGDPKTWNDGKPKMGKVITGLVVSATDVTLGTADGAPAATAGDLVSIWCEGSRFIAYRDAIRDGNGINVGDVMRWTREADGPSAVKGGYPAKMYTAAIRRPEAKDGDLADRCVAAYHDQASRPALDSAPADTAFASYETQTASYGTETPF